MTWQPHSRAVAACGCDNGGCRGDGGGSQNAKSPPKRACVEPVARVPLDEDKGADPEPDKEQGTGDADRLERQLVRPQLAY